MLKLCSVVSTKFRFEFFNQTLGKRKQWSTWDITYSIFIQLIETGFEYVIDINGVKLFRKLKTSYLGTVLHPS